MLLLSQEIHDRLGLTEFRSIISAINRTYRIDFNDYALTSIKRRFEKVYTYYNFKEIDDLILKIENDTNFFEQFLFDISIEETEMFRDPPMWLDLKENILPKFQSDSDIKIWVPDITSGDELYSLLVLLKEARMLENTQVYATSFCSKNIEQIKTGIIDIKKIETNTSNYRRLRSDFQLSRYIDVEEKRAIFDVNLFKIVTFIKQDIFRDKQPSAFKLILFRNKMLYYNQQLQTKALDIMFNCLLPGGYFITGINENIDGYGFHDKLTLINQTENIYKKALV